MKTVVVLASPAVQILLGHSELPAHSSKLGRKQVLQGQWRLLRAHVCVTMRFAMASETPRICQAPWHLMASLMVSCHRNVMPKNFLKCTNHLRTGDLDLAWIRPLSVKAASPLRFRASCAPALWERKLHDIASQPDTPPKSSWRNTEVRQTVAQIWNCNLPHLCQRRLSEHLTKRT